MTNWKPNPNYTKLEYRFAIMLTLSLLALAFYRIFLTFFEDNTSIYNGYIISDYMINYQGGFVRRGLIGEIMYQIFQIHPYSFHTAILYLDLFSWLVLLVITARICIEKKLLPIYPLAIFMGTLSYRRDFMMIVIAYYIYQLLIKYISSKRNCYFIASSVLTILSILIYEPSFFFIVPISVLIFWNSIKEESPHYQIRSLLKTFSLPLVAMILVCLSKGSNAIATSIWNSWLPLFDYIGKEYLPDHIPAAINFLERPTGEVIKFHLDLNYHLWDNKCFLYTTGSLFFFIISYYLTTRAPRKQNAPQQEYLLLSDVYIAQFVCLLPMFSILSCDFGRTIYYVILTSYMLTYLLLKNGIQLEVPIIHTISVKMQSLFGHRLFFNNIWCHTVLLFLIPYNIACGISIFHPLWNEYEPMLMPKLRIILNIIGL